MGSLTAMLLSLSVARDVYSQVLPTATVTNSSKACLDCITGWANCTRANAAAPQFCGLYAPFVWMSSPSNLCCCPLDAVCKLSTNACVCQSPSNRTAPSPSQTLRSQRCVAECRTDDALTDPMPTRLPKTNMTPVPEVETSHGIALFRTCLYIATGLPVLYWIIKSISRSRALQAQRDADAAMAATAARLPPFVAAQRPDQPAMMAVRVVEAVPIAQMSEVAANVPYARLVEQPRDNGDRFGDSRVAARDAGM
ncbi:Aste57867_9523 [Aphanomyces stellatus]|uniref:Aste57867_9523 protein n=1 Tax=Aphanomyces stellatus TaxID=120398 RepID=A0A485KN74_9STRA|nr:hypothetical protein As57867_009486 [Aphanomyces stellatus]VFT86402.1 Aste57867_9523 [Aphanomyces stellatus]